MPNKIKKYGIITIIYNITGGEKSCTARLRQQPFLFF